MIARLAARNLFRNRWRSALAAGGVAVATFLLTWSICLFDGMIAQMINGATAVEMGQIQVHARPYVDRPTLYHHFAQDDVPLDEITALPGIVAVSPRVHAYGLAGHERRSQVVHIIGVDPLRESRTTVVADSLIDGRWLSPSPASYPAAREVVVGAVFAEQLDLSVGDEVVLFLQAADGSLGNDLLSIAGIIRTGNLMVDRQGLYMHLADVQYDAVLEGRLHELAIRIEDLDRSTELAASVEGVLRQTGAGSSEELVVRPWQAIVPELQMYVEMSDRGIWVTLVLAYLMVALGILNAQRMSAMERRREFGVLLAIGLTPRQLATVVVTETVFLTLAGAILGAAVGLALSAYHAHAGFDMSLFSDQASFTYQGVAFSERMYTVLSVGSVLTPLIAVTVVAILCGLWPALKSARLNATQAISGRT